MDSQQTHVREATPEDEAGLVDLERASADGGAIKFRAMPLVPPQRAHLGLHEGTIVAVAETRDGRIVGRGRLHHGRALFQGRTVPYAMFNTLAVHPDFRGRGIAGELTRWRLERAAGIVGEDALVVANIQEGNPASLANARRWAKQITGRLIVVPVPMRGKPPKPHPDLTVREAGDADWEQIAAGLAAASEPYTIASTWDGARLRAWAAASPLPRPVNHYLVAADGDGRIVAGLGLRMEYLLQDTFVDRMPGVMKLANRVVKVIPRDGHMRNIAVKQLWYAPGRLDAGRHLWDTMRWEWRDRGSSLLCIYDPKGPAHPVIRPPKRLPASKISIAVRSAVPLDDTALIESL